ncbi:MAG: hypothetical protein V9H25_04350 [Candidatus Competibacter sp.]
MPATTLRVLKPAKPCSATNCSAARSEISRSSSRVCSLRLPMRILRLAEVA